MKEEDQHENLDRLYGENLVPRVKPSYTKTYFWNKLYFLFTILGGSFFGYKIFRAEFATADFFGFGFFMILISVMCWGIIDETKCPSCKKYFSTKESRVYIQKYYFKRKK